MTRTGVPTGNLVEQMVDILGIELDAAMADIAPDAVRLVGAVEVR